MAKGSDFDFGETLKRLREARGMMQKDLGAKMEIDPNRISNWEKGYNYPTLPVFREMCIALGCSADEPLGLDPDEMSISEYKLLQGFRMLDEAGQHTMMAVLESQLAVRAEPGG